MSRIKRSVLAVAVALVLALVGSAMVWLYVKGADNRALKDKEPVTVLIAAKDIPKGTTGADIRSGGYVKQVRMPKNSVPAEGALSEVREDLSAASLSAALPRGHLLLRDMFQDKPTDSTGLGLPEGKVAVTVPVLTTTGTSLVRAGSTVAMFKSFTALGGDSVDQSRPAIDNQPGGDDFERKYEHMHATRLLFPRMEVLLVGSAADLAAAASQDSGSGSGSGTSLTEKESDKEKSDSGPVSDSVLITFAVTQAEAEKLILASETGHLYIALVNDKSEIAPGPGVDYDSMFD